MKKVLLLTAFLALFLAVSAMTRSDADMWFLQAKYYYFERFDYVRAYECLKKALKADPEHENSLKLSCEMEEIIAFMEQNAKPAPVVKPVDEQVETEIPDIEEIPVPEEQEEQIPYPAKEDFDYQLALRRIEELEYDEAIDLLTRHLESRPEHVDAYFHLFLVAVKTGRERLIQWIYDKTASFLPRIKEREDCRRFLELVECHRCRLVCARAVMEYNRDIALKNNIVQAFRYRFLDYDRERPVYDEMEELDLEKLKTAGYLESVPECPSDGIYTLQGERVICTYHDVLIKTPYRDMLASRSGQKPVSLADRYRSFMHIENAREMVTKKRYFRGLAESEQAIKLNPLDYRGYDLMAQCYYSLESYEKALTWAEQARELAVGEPLVYNNLGLIYTALDMLDDAVRVLKLGLAIRTGDYDLHYNLGMAYQKKGDLEKALACFDAARIIKPSSAGAWFNLGRIYQETGRKDEARATYSKILNLVPQDGKVYNMVINILESL